MLDFYSSLYRPVINEVNLRSPHLWLGPVRPGLVRKDLTHGGPADQVPGEHEGESVRGVTRAENPQVSWPVMKRDDPRVRVVSVKHRVAVLQTLRKSCNKNIKMLAEWVVNILWQALRRLKGIRPSIIRPQQITEQHDVLYFNVRIESVSAPDSSYMQQATSALDLLERATRYL